MVFAGQMCVALCFAELAGQYPLAGSVYQWSKRIGSDAVSWMTGWILIIGSIVTVAAVAVGWQVVLPLITTKLQFIGGNDRRTPARYFTPDGAKNALLLGAILVIIATIVNMLGVRVMAVHQQHRRDRELVGCSVLVILLIFHFVRGPGVVTETLGTGHGHSWGYFGAFLIGGIMSAYVMYGFDTAGTLAEETHDPRRAAPPAILRALAAAALLGGLLILFALMSVPNIHDAANGLPALIKQVLGNTTGDVFLADLGAGDHGLRAWRSARPASGCCSRWPVTADCRPGQRSPGSPVAPRCRSSRRCSSGSARWRCWRSTSPTSQRS